MSDVLDKPPVTISSSAAKRIGEILAGEPMGTMLRISISGGGCSGFSYGFSLDGNVTGDDRVFEFHGATLVVDDVSLGLLQGSEIDYVDDLRAAAFRINNPNATATCGCGTSFSA